MNKEAQPYLFPVEEYEVIQNDPVLVTWVMMLDVANPMDPKILVSERVGDGSVYTFPGGKVKEDESIVNAALREMEEEIGIEIYSDSNIFPATHDIVEYQHNGKELEAIYFFCFKDDRADSDDPKLMEPDKHKGWEWISFKNLRQLTEDGRFPRFVWDDDWIYDAINRIMDKGMNYWGESPAMNDIKMKLRDSGRLIPAYMMIDCVLIQAESEMSIYFGLNE